MLARGTEETEVDMIGTRRGVISPRRIARWSVLMGVALAAVLLATPAPQALAAKPLSGGFTIAGGAQFTNDNDVVLVSTVKGALQMRFKNVGGTYTTWEPYARSKDWQVSPGDGLKTVEAQYKGSTGARLTVVADITLDTTGPVTSSDYDGTPQRSVTVTLTAVDALSDVVGTWYRVDGRAWVEGNLATLLMCPKRSGLRAGPHTLEFYSTDVLGNVGDMGSAVIVLQ